MVASEVNNGKNQSVNHMFEELSIKQGDSRDVSSQVATVCYMMMSQRDAFKHGGGFFVQTLWTEMLENFSLDFVCSSNKILEEFFFFICVKSHFLAFSSPSGLYVV